MKEHPLICDTESVEGILTDIKTQTRRVTIPQPKNIEDPYPIADSHICFGDIIEKPDYYSACGYSRYGTIGDHLWVRETWNNDWCDHVIYKADGGSAKEAGYKNEPRWKPSIFMPRKLSRITLEIKDIRVERVQDISEEDAKAEGVIAGFWNQDISHAKLSCRYVTNPDGTKRSLKEFQNEFSFRWDDINGGRNYEWEKNVWVWAVTFKRIK